MKNKNIKISYDKEDEVLSIEAKKGKSVDSDIQGNIVIDYDKNGDIVRMNLYKFSFDKFRSDLKMVKNFARDFKLPFVVR